MDMLATNSAITHLLDLPSNPEVQQELEGKFGRAALAAGRSSMASLGFDPSKTVLDVVNDNASVGGVYSPKNDLMYANFSFPTGSAIVHESIHRGITLLQTPSKDDTPEIAKIKEEARKLLRDLPDEELIVRHMMDKIMGNPEESAGGKKNVDQIQSSRNAFEDKSRQDKLARLEALATEMYKKQHQEMGPR